ncbi:MAG TPA: D-sedoheptulose 7-phosphate isomerase [Bacteroidia bacterium]|nr:D-sedoheptulose 7-phosphate isomerase [Bacteroidia bacterium]
MNSIERIKQNFSEANSALQKFMNDEEQLKKIAETGNILSQAFKNGNKAISCGNGGSMCDAMHFAEELSGRFRADRKPLPAISISDASHISCVANDYGFEFIFSRFIEAMGDKGDVLLAISTSGNSKNILNAADVARKKGMKIISLTGKDGGKLASLSDVEIRAPHSEFSDRTQEIHIKVIHVLIDLVEQELAVV